MNLVEVVNRTRMVVDDEAVARLVAKVLDAEGMHGAEVAVEFVGEARMRGLNRDHRGKDEVTDVLSFPLEDWPSPGDAAAGSSAGGSPRTLEPDEIAEAVTAAVEGPPRLLGDVVICARRALRQASAGDLPPSVEVAVLLVHGTLHLLGHDHEMDAGQMALRQAEILEQVEWEGLVVAAR